MSDTPETEDKKPRRRAPRPSSISRGEKASRRFEAALGTRAPALVTIAAAATRVDYLGKSWEVDLSETLGQPGLPWSSGLLRVERNPELHPLQARGLGSNPGVFWELRNNPQVQAAVSPPVQAVASAPYRLGRPELPDWADELDELALERQYALQQRVWWDWTREDGRPTWRACVEDNLLTAIICGFSWAEILAEQQFLQLPGDASPQLYYVPDLPEWRAPWTVRYWIVQAGRVVGIDASFSGSLSNSGSPRMGDYRVVYPQGKYVHITADDVSSNPEGRSWLRPAYPHIGMLRDGEQVDALAVETNALGTIVIKQDKERPFADEERERLEEHLDNYAARHVPWVVMPPGGEYEVKSPLTQLPQLGSHLDRLERVVLMSLKGSHQLIALQKAGSYAAREDASREAREALSYIVARYIQPIWGQVMGAIIKANWPEDWAAGRIYVAPLLVGDMTASNAPERVGALAQAVTGGLLTWTPADEAALRSELSLSPNPTGVAGDLSQADDAQRQVLAAGDRLVSTREAAETLAISAATVVALIRAGELTGVRSGSRWKVTWSSVLDYLERNIFSASAAAEESAPDAADTEITDLT